MAVSNREFAVYRYAGITKDIRPAYIHEEYAERQSVAKGRIRFPTSSLQCFILVVKKPVNGWAVLRKEDHMQE